jgi:hypothetical protein
MNNRNDLDKEWYFTTFIKSIQFFLALVMIGMIVILLFGCEGNTIHKDGKIYEVNSRCTNGYYNYVWNGKFMQSIWICTEHEYDTIFIEYEKPIVADTVKNDFVKDSTIGWEKRLVYDQMLEDGWR